MTRAAIIWPADRAHEAIEALARRSGLVRSAPPIIASSADPPGDARELAQRIDRATQQLGLEAEPVRTDYLDLDVALSDAAPALWRIESQDHPGYGIVAVVGKARGSIMVLDTDLGVCKVPLHEIRELLVRRMESAAAREVESILSGTPLDEPSRSKVRYALVRERLAHAKIDGCWMLRLPPGAPFLQQLQQAGVRRSLVNLIGLHAVQQAFWIIAWWIVGASALMGRTDRGWLTAWALVVACIVLLRLQSSWTSGRLLYIAGGLLKQRLLAGILRLDVEALHRQGSGRLLGKVLESSAIEQLTLSGGFNTALAMIELVSAAFVLAIGPTRGIHLPLLAAWIGLAALGTWRYTVRRRAWTAARLSVTQQLVERLAGHRTRLAQERPERWHEGEDEALEDYARTSARLDDSALAMSTLVRTWVFAGLVGIVPALTYGGQPATTIAIGVGGILMAAQALARFNAGVGSLIGALIAGGQIRELFRAARAESPLPTRDLVAPTAERALDAKGVRFQYPNQHEPILRDCDLRLGPADRVLIEGPSGSGKSTLAKLLGGLLEPQAGVVLLNGLDRPSIGVEAWRRRINFAPAMQENHIFTGTLAFNVLLGRGWPPTPDDLEAAERTCRELGLGPLLDRMPAGIMQLVGETGWQLSQGEKSRVFVARALLSGGDVLLLDESFGSLDPVTLRQCLKAVLAQPQAVLVFAHP